MDVVFRSRSKSQNRFTITDNSNIGTLFFDKGIYKTADKRMIEKLLNHPLKKRGEIKLVSNPELVAKYLDGEEPDKLTKEILRGITRQGIIELGKVLGSVESQPTLIRAEIVGSPITDEVQEILDFYRSTPDKKEKVETIAETEEIEEKEVIEAKPKNKGGRPKGSKNKK